MRLLCYLFRFFQVECLMVWPSRTSPTIFAIFSVTLSFALQTKTISVIIHEQLIFADKG
jgi:hypothetical protein